MREHRRIQQTLALSDRLDAARRQLEENEELAKGDDPELAEIAREEIPALQAEIPRLAEDLQYALLPADPNEDRDAIVEIRAGAGGDEASLFAAELLRLYQRYADSRGWKTEHLSSSPSEVGGFKEVFLRVTGDEVFRTLKYESGVHRVQRVPATETQGRVHTSTVTVAVMPEAEEVDVELKPDDLRIEVCRAGGAGGQHVNRTESAVQVFHLPTGLYVRCEDGRSQGQNKERALQIMRTRLYEMKLREEQEKHSAHRRALSEIRAMAATLAHDNAEIVGLRAALSEIRAMAATLSYDHAEIVGLRAIAVIADIALGEREIDRTRYTLERSE
jgi:peptide chain release factor 1